MEQTLNKPLSGTEVIKTILYDIEQALLVDGRLAPHLAFNGFAFRMELHVDLPGTPNPEFSRPISGNRNFAGVTPEEAAAGSGVDLTTSREHASPDDQRYETEQPIPVLVNDPRGGTREELKSYRGRDKKGKVLSVAPRHQAVPRVTENDGA